MVWVFFLQGTRKLIESVPVIRESNALLTCDKLLKFEYGKFEKLDSVTMFTWGINGKSGKLFRIRIASRVINLS